MIVAYRLIKETWLIIKECFCTVIDHTLRTVRRTKSHGNRLCFVSHFFVLRTPWSDVMFNLLQYRRTQKWNLFVNTVTSVRMRKNRTRSGYNCKCFVTSHNSYYTRHHTFAEIRYLCFAMTNVEPCLQFRCLFWTQIQDDSKQTQHPIQTNDFRQHVLL